MKLLYPKINQNDFLLKNISKKDKKAPTFIN